MDYNKCIFDKYNLNLLFKLLGFVILISILIYTIKYYMYLRDISNQNHKSL